jgi:hypothetical protein
LAVLPQKGVGGFRPFQKDPGRVDSAEAQNRFAEVEQNGLDDFRFLIFDL